MESLQSGQALARGVARHLQQLEFYCLPEFVPARGLRVDLAALGPKGEIWVIECKSSRADFMADNKWQGYLDWCDRYFWAVSADFPQDFLPIGTGVILADSYDAEIIRAAPQLQLHPNRRKKMILKFARNAAQRLARLTDPMHHEIV